MNNTKKSIFQSAMKIFSENGYNGATMDDIAINAGVAKGTLYYHFKSKEEIFKYVISEGMEIVTQEMREVTANEQNSIDKLVALWKNQISMVYRNRDFFKVIMSQVWGQESRQAELREVIKAYISEIEKYIKDAVASEEDQKGQTTFMAYTFLGTMVSGALYELINGEHTKAEEIIGNIITYVVKGIETSE